MSFVMLNLCSRDKYKTDSAVIDIGVNFVIKGRGVMANAERESITEPPAGPRGRDSGQGLGGRSPLKLKAFCLSDVQMGRKFAHFCYLVNCSNMLFERIIVAFSC